MEFCDHGTLSDFFTPNVFSYFYKVLYSKPSLNSTEPNIWRFVGQMSCALVYIHNKNILHRDIKPDNILVHEDTSTGRLTCKLADFGIAKLLTEKAETEYYTRTGIGIPVYMAPEALRVQLTF